MKKLLFALVLASVGAVRPCSSQIQLIAHASNSSSSMTTSPMNITGSTIVLVCSAASNATISDNQGNVYNRVATGAFQGSTDLALYAAFKPTNSSSLTISSTGYGGLTAAAFSGVSRLDQVASASGNGLTVGPISPTNDRELIFSCLDSNWNQSTSASTSSPLALLDSSINPGNNYGNMTSAYAVQTTKAAVSNTWTTDDGNGKIRSHHQLLRKCRSACLR